MNKYHFIVEIEPADIKEMKKVFKGRGNIRKVPMRMNEYYSEEFECMCYISVFQLKTNLDLDDVKKLLLTGSDLHYAYNSIKKV